MNIKNIFIQKFPLAKLKNDLFSYLAEMKFSYNEHEHSYKVPTYIIEQEEYVNYYFYINDSINIISMSCEFWHKIDIHYSVLVAIGIFEPNEKQQDLFKTEKGLAKMKYNEDLSLYDIEFYVHESNLLGDEKWKKKL